MSIKYIYIVTTSYDEEIEGVFSTIKKAEKTLLDVLLSYDIKPKHTRSIHRYQINTNTRQTRYYGLVNKELDTDGKWSQQRET